MSKTKTPRSLKDNEAKCVARMLRVSPQKLNLLAQLIRGKKVETALADLEFSRKRISLEVRKALQSAIANAENNANLSADSLFVKSAVIENGPVLKRFKAGARGTAMPRRKKMSHIRIVLSDGNTN